MFFVNKIDDDRADYQKTLEEMKEKFGKSVTPFVYPIREGDEFKGFVDIVDMTARRYEGQDEWIFLYPTVWRKLSHRLEK